MTKTATSASDARRIAGMLANFSIELNPTDSKAIEVAEKRLEPGTEVFLTWIASEDPLKAVAPAARLRRAGLLPVPHLGARHIQSEPVLRQFVTQLVEAGVDRVLVVGGDAPKPAGPFDSSLAVLQSGILQDVGIRRVGVGGFPEGNPHVKGVDLIDLLVEKIEFGLHAGMEMSIVTQFCFQVEPIAEWLRLVRARGLQVPVRLGLAGPAGILTLSRYALRCGVGRSLRVLTENPAFAKLLVENGPEPLVRGLAEKLGANGTLPEGVAGLHFFPFGGVSKALDWIHSCRLAATIDGAA